MQVSLRGKDVRIATGGRDHADDPTAPAVVMLHGAGMDRTTWQMQSRWLAHHGWRVAAVDLPGHGLSEGPPHESIADMASWTEELIVELDLAPAHLVGFSLGTFVAIELAAAHPELVRSLVLIGTASAMPVHPVLLDASRNDVPAASRLMTSWGVGSRGHRGGHPSPGMWLIGSSTAMVDTSPEGALEADLRACDDYKDAVASAAKIEAPVTFVLGHEDKMTPMRASADLVDAVRTHQVLTLPATGHMMPIEAPIDVRRAIESAIAWSEQQSEPPAHSQ